MRSALWSSNSPDALDGVADKSGAPATHKSSHASLIYCDLEPGADVLVLSMVNLRYTRVSLCK